MSRRRRDGSDGTFMFLIAIIIGIPLAIYGILKWLFKGLTKLALKIRSEKEESSTEFSSTSNNNSFRSHNLNKNELPQGEYIVGKDIPEGVYDFVVVYGNGGRFEIAQYDENNNFVPGTWNLYWVGLQKSYEKKELIHIDCKKDYTVKISGNVILKIVKSQKVKIEL